MKKVAVNCVYNFDSDAVHCWPLHALEGLVSDFVERMQKVAEAKPDGTLTAIVDERTETFFEVSLRMINGALENGIPVSIDASWLAQIEWLHRVEFEADYLVLLIKKEDVYVRVEESNR